MLGLLLKEFLITTLLGTISSYENLNDSKEYIISREFFEQVSKKLILN